MMDQADAILSSRQRLQAQVGAPSLEGRKLFTKLTQKTIMLPINLFRLVMENPQPKSLFSVDF